MYFLLRFKFCYFVNYKLESVTEVSVVLYENVYLNGSAASICLYRILCNLVSLYRLMQLSRLVD
jgi:hypothetical protein